MRQILTRLLHNQKGVTGVEYAFIASLIAMATMGGMSSLGNAVEAQFGLVGARYAAVGP